jgi:hypothetical protein
MINSEVDGADPAAPHDDRVDSIVRAGAPGAIALAGVATAVVIAIWFAFYLFVFVPRAGLP